MSAVENEQQSRQIPSQTNELARREALVRAIRSNEERMYALIEPTAQGRLILVERGARTRLPNHVLQADQNGAAVLTERLTVIARTRGEARTFEELKRYNREIIRTCLLFNIYRQFQMWQASQLRENRERSDSQ